ncbi:MAG: hypothetical protein ABJB33_06385 [Gemmatimonadota bacterium]
MYKAYRYESKQLRPISTRHFAHRMLGHFLTSQLLVVAALFIGMAGFHLTEELPWLDAFLQSAMLLGGMGPVGQITHESGKLFAGFYALFCGLLFIVVAGLLIAPVVHRILHRLHWDDDQK